MVKRYLSTKFGINLLDEFWENGCLWMTDGQTDDERRRDDNTLPLIIFYFNICLLLCKLNIYWCYFRHDVRFHHWADIGKCSVDTKALRRPEQPTPVHITPQHTGVGWSIMGRGDRAALDKVGLGHVAEIYWYWIISSMYSNVLTVSKRPGKMSSKL